MASSWPRCTKAFRTRFFEALAARLPSFRRFEACRGGSSARSATMDRVHARLDQFNCKRPSRQRRSGRWCRRSWAGRLPQISHVRLCIRHARRALRRERSHVSRALPLETMRKFMAAMSSPCSCCDDRRLGDVCGRVPDPPRRAHSSRPRRPRAFRVAVTMMVATPLPSLAHCERRASGRPHAAQHHGPAGSFAPRPAGVGSQSFARAKIAPACNHRRARSSSRSPGSRAYGPISSRSAPSGTC